MWTLLPLQGGLSCQMGLIHVIPHRQLLASHLKASRGKLLHLVSIQNIMVGP